MEAQNCAVLDFYKNSDMILCFGAKIDYTQKND